MTVIALFTQIILSTEGIYTFNTKKNDKYKYI